MLKLYSFQFLFFFFFILVFSENYFAKQTQVDRRVSIVLLRVNDSLIYVCDKISGKYSLPGGIIEKNESAVDAANREVLEETGIKIHNLKPIIDSKQFIVYRAKSQNPIEVAYSPYLNAYFVDTHHSKHFFKEISYVIASNPKNLPIKQIRSKFMYDHILPLWHYVEPSDYIIKKNFTDNYPESYTQPLNHVRFIQTIIFNSKILKVIIYGLNQLGSFLFLILIFPILSTYLNQRDYQNFVFTSFTTLLTLATINNIIITPAPFHIEPILQKAPHTSNTLLSSQVLLTFVIFFYSFIKRFSIKKNLLMSFIVSSFVGISQISLGLFFIKKILISLLFSSIMTVSFAQVFIKKIIPFYSFFYLLPASIMLGIFFKDIYFLHILGLCLGYSIGLFSKKYLYNALLYSGFIVSKKRHLILTSLFSIILLISFYFLKNLSFFKSIGTLICYGVQDIILGVLFSQLFLISNQSKNNLRIP